VTEKDIYIYRIYIYTVFTSIKYNSSNH